MASKHIVIPIFVPHKGCPFDCIFCNQKNISGQKDDMTEDKMISIIESHIRSACEDAYIEIGFYGGSFTGIDREEQYRYLETANRYIKKGRVKGIRLSTRPDYITKDILGYLKEYSVSTIELGVQSLDNEVLQKSCRGHSVEDVYNASALIKEMGFILGIQTMIGLPGDSREKALQTAKKVVNISPDILRIYPTLVVRDTYLEKMYTEGQYTPLELDEAVELCAELLYVYEKNNINVIRIGLQPTESINEGGDVIAGPFHPAFRQLVESRMALDTIERAIIEKNLSNKSSLVICTGKKEISNVIGQGRKNVEYLRKKYKYDKIIVIECNGGHELYDIKY
ncbi:elongator complex protein 3 [Acetivibrio mesophilus]|uniref:Radical SAM protein n=1 Tax=Acetivibrio mesophilus TaxID=2487273 RepID=A0A4Q0I9T1_9FIRM|nr:radical SAM protein [Acetivibrio mesophilus]ODM25219.1 radical SAM protein [Clostridium sp. Bc-iso-3]RXE59762.1 radical SAM protein [Acetivibrio mesophilus]HHV29316.1 radical SAM protein [Clostridium sp.]